jgi:hypothetical protein
LAVWDWMPMDDYPYLLPHLPHEIEKRGVGLDTVRNYGQLWMVIYTGGSAVDGMRRRGSSAVVTSGDPGNPTFLDVRQCGPEYTTSLEVEMYGLWLALDCLDDEA